MSKVVKALIYPAYQLPACGINSALPKKLSFKKNGRAELRLNLLS